MDGLTDAYRLTSAGDIIQTGKPTAEQKDISQLVALEGDAGAWMLKYSMASGRGDLLLCDENGGILRHRTHKNWSRSWSQIIPVRRQKAHSPGVLFYEAHSGTGEFYDVMDDGDVALSRRHLGWGKTWSQIIPVPAFAGDGTTLLFYDAQEGQGELYSFEKNGEMSLPMTLLKDYEGWRKSWSRIVPICCGGIDSPLLLFYDASAGQGEFYHFAQDYGLIHVATRDGWSKSWSHVLAVKLDS